MKREAEAGEGGLFGTSPDKGGGKARGLSDTIQRQKVKNDGHSG